MFPNVVCSEGPEDPNPRPIIPTSTSEAGASLSSLTFKFECQDIRTKIQHLSIHFINCVEMIFKPFIEHALTEQREGALYLKEQVLPKLEELCVYLRSMPIKYSNLNRDNFLTHCTQVEAAIKEVNKHRLISKLKTLILNNVRPEVIEEDLGIGIRSTRNFLIKAQLSWIDELASAGETLSSAYYEARKARWGQPSVGHHQYSPGDYTNGLLVMKQLYSIEMEKYHYDHLLQHIETGIEIPKRFKQSKTKSIKLQIEGLQADLIYLIQTASTTCSTQRAAALGRVINHCSSLHRELPHNQVIRAATTELAKYYRQHFNKPLRLNRYVDVQNLNRDTTLKVSGIVAIPLIYATYNFLLDASPVSLIALIPVTWCICQAVCFTASFLIRPWLINQIQRNRLKKIGAEFTSQGFNNLCEIEYDKPKHYDPTRYPFLYSPLAKWIKSPDMSEFKAP